MLPLTLSAVLAALQAANEGAGVVLNNVEHNAAWHAEVILTEASIDSRQVISGGLFIALPGERTDGHAYVGEAFQRGAVCAIIQRDLTPADLTPRSRADAAAAAPIAAHLIDLRPGSESSTPAAGTGAAISTSAPAAICLRVDNSLQALQQIARYWRRQLDVRIIGITGSVGKSTTKELVAEVLSQRYRTLRTVGNLNNEIGLPLMLLSLSAGHERAVLEMGFYVLGEIAFLCDLAQPHIGVITNIGTVHAERAGSQAIIAQGKRELVENLPTDGVAILNYDDPLVRAMSAHTKARVFFYGLAPVAHNTLPRGASHLWADQVEGLGLNGIRFRLHYQGETIYLRVPMIGQHSVHTALRAAAVGLADGLTWDEIIEGLRSSTTQLRLIAVRASSGALILDDTYNASPESTLAALNLLAEINTGFDASIPVPSGLRKIAVLGDMLELGIYEEIGHQKVGIRAAEVADHLLTVGPLAHQIAAAARSAGLPAAAITETESTAQAAEWLQSHLQPNDAVLIKGSHGLRMDRIVGALSLEAAPSGESR